METLELSPSYGRDYKTAKDVQTAWDEGKDFTVESYGPDMGRQINKQDAKPGTTLMIRYKKLTQIKIIKIK